MKITWAMLTEEAQRMREPNYSMPEWLLEALFLYGTRGVIEMALSEHFAREAIEIVMGTPQRVGVLNGARAGWIVIDDLPEQTFKDLHTLAHGPRLPLGPPTPTRHYTTLNRDWRKRR